MEWVQCLAWRQRRELAGVLVWEGIARWIIHWISLTISIITQKPSNRRKFPQVMPSQIGSGLATIIRHMVVPSVLLFLLIHRLSLASGRLRCKISQILRYRAQQVRV